MGEMSKKVYLLADEEDYRKIGCSKSPEKRLKSVQTGNPRKVSLVGSITLKDLPQRWLDLLDIDSEEELEKELQKRHEKYREHGEWFYFPSQIALHIDDLFINGCSEGNIPLRYAYSKEKITVDNLLRDARKKFRNSDFFKPVGHQMIFKTGKYKGKTLREIKQSYPGYLRWMVEQDELEEIDYLIANMAKEGFSKKTICEAILAPKVSKNNNLSQILKRVKNLEDISNYWQARKKDS